MITYNEIREAIPEGQLIGQSTDRAIRARFYLDSAAFYVARDKVGFEFNPHSEFGDSLVAKVTSEELKDRLRQREAGEIYDLSMPIIPAMADKAKASCRVLARDMLGLLE